MSMNTLNLSMSASATKKIAKYAEHLQRAADLEKELLGPEVRQFYPVMADEKWLAFCKNYPVDKPVEAPKPAKPEEKPKKKKKEEAS